MPSPFPGMDPYLEDPDLWPDVHAALLSALTAELIRQPRPNYVARLSLRPVGRAADVPGELHPPERFGRLIDVRDRSVVTIVEILHPANKVVGSASRRSCETARRQTLGSPANLVEIDLLRSGKRVFAIDHPQSHDYAVHVSRASGDGAPRRSTVLAIPMTARLPVVLFPVREGEADAAIDLQGVLDVAYRCAAYDVDTDYAADPVPPVAGDRAEWVRATARAAVPPA